MIKDNLKRSFTNKGIFLKDSWLHSMIDSGLKSYELIFAHLIELDILETCEPCPLPDITREPKFIYQGENVNQSYTLPQIFLQINEVIDTPAYKITVTQKKPDDLKIDIDVDIDYEYH